MVSVSENTVLAKWYKTNVTNYELVIHKGGTSKLVLPLLVIPTDEEVLTALKLFGGCSAEVIITNTEKRPYRIIESTEVDDYYNYNEELKNSPVHIEQTKEIREAVRKRIKEDSE